MPFDPSRFTEIHQVGGIRTGTLDQHPGTSGTGCRVAHVDTGAGLRFTVAIDRGGDIVDASFMDTNLSFLTPNGYAPATPARHAGLNWLQGWPGGLLTTCGPVYIGGPREEHGDQLSLHGHHSNIPAAVCLLQNPDPRSGRMDMVLGLIIRDTSTFGPTVQVEREIRATLGTPAVQIRDTVTNLGDTAVAHNLLYHINFGYPFIDTGTDLIFGGSCRLTAIDDLGLEDTQDPLANDANLSDAVNDLKRITGPNPNHVGTGEQCVIVEPTVPRDGISRIGVINESRKVGIEIRYPHAQLPRLANWQHLGPNGSFVTALEPYFGSLLGLARDPHLQAEQWLAPGDSRTYDLSIQVLQTPEQFASLREADMALSVLGSV